jgi:PadR family transcriptional regulator, regulatory protein PadR
MTPEMLKGHLDMLLLAVLHPRPAHGYAIIEALREHSGGAFDLPEGTVYPALHRLERDGLLQSAWSDETGRRRRVYELTERGHAAFEERQRAWSRFGGAIDAVLRAAEPALQEVGHGRPD